MYKIEVRYRVGQGNDCIADIICVESDMSCDCKLFQSREHNGATGMKTLYAHNWAELRKEVQRTLSVVEDIIEVRRALVAGRPKPDDEMIEI